MSEPQATVWPFEGTKLAVPAEGCERTWLLLNLSPDDCYGRIVPVA